MGGAAHTAIAVSSGRLAEAAWMAVVMPDYSLVSEAVALEEMVEVYTALLAAGKTLKRW